MTLKALLKVLGTLVGLAAGILAGVMTGFFFLGVNWLFLFGDDSWPAYSILIIIIPAALVFAVCTVGGYFAGSYTAHRLASAGKDTPRTRAMVVALLGAYCVAVAIAWHYMQRFNAAQNQQRAERATQEEQACKLAASLPRIVQSAATLSADRRRAEIQIMIEGERGGDYGMELSVVDYRHRALLTQKREATLMPPQQVFFTLEYSDLIEKYRAAYPADARICEPVQFSFLLTPLLNEKENKLRNAMLNCTPGGLSWPHKPIHSQFALKADICTYGETFKTYH